MIKVLDWGLGAWFLGLILSLMLFATCPGDFLPWE